MSEARTVRRCGRATRSGKPCQAIIGGFDVSCKKHATEGDTELSEWYERGFHAGNRVGEEAAACCVQHNKERVQELEQEVKQLELRLKDASSYYEIDGDQVVEINGRYAYRWSGSPKLEIGDRVILPPNWFTTTIRGTGSSEGTVTGLGTTYQGDLARIVRRVAHDSRRGS